MTIRKVLGVAAIVCGAVLLAAPAFAHHSFAAEWDSTKCRDFTGTLTKARLAEPPPLFLR